MQEKVLETIARYDMLRDTDAVTVALSGGADSVALLHCMLSLKDKLGIKVHALHLNHNLRGAESLRDEEFVKNLCKKWNVPLTVENADVNSVSILSGESIELAARRVRYAFFEKYCIGKCATAHTGSDSAETVLFNLTRGTALSGVCGIPPVRDIYIRPLINCTRAEIEQYCSDNDLEFVNDSTNFTDEYTRNKIRHNVVSVLREINPSFENAVSRLSAAAREDEDYLSSVACELYKQNFIDGKLQLAAVTSTHASVAKRVLKIYYDELIGGELDSTNLDLLLKTACNQIGATVLPSKVKAHVKNGFLIFDLNEKTEKNTYKTEIVKEKAEKFNNLLSKNLLDCGKIEGKLVVRTRETGDKIRLANRGVTKSLKKLFTELKIPEDVRQTLPVVSDDAGVVWVYGVGVAERVKVESTTKEIFIIKSEKILG